MKTILNLKFLILIFAAISLTGCIKSTHDGSGNLGSTISEGDIQDGFGGDPNDPENSSGVPSIPLKVNGAGPTVGTLSYEAIYTNMSVLTGIDKGRCEADYNQFRASMPMGNNIQTLTAAGQASVVKLAACFCQNAIINNRNNGRARLVPGLNYNTDGDNLNNGDFDNIINSMTSRFWGQGLSTLPEATMVSTELGDLVRSSVQNDQNANDPDATLRAVFSVCTATLGSLPTFIMM